MDELDGKIRTIARRLVIRTCIRKLAKCLMWAFWASLGLIIVDKLYFLVLPAKPLLGASAELWGRELPGYVMYGVLAMLVACVPAAALWTYLTGITRMKAAVLADKQLGLKERLSSALAVTRADEPMAPALHEDALNHARRLDTAKAVPYALPRGTRMAPIPVLCSLLVFGLMPNFDPDVRDQTQRVAERAELDKKVERLDRQIKKLQKLPKQANSDILPKTIKAMEKVRDRLKSPRTKPEDAVRALAELTKELEKLQKQTKGPKMKGLASKGFDPAKDLENDLARKIAESIDKGDMKDAMKAIEELREKIKNADKNGDELKELARDLERLAKEIDPKKAEQLKRQMDKLAKAMKQLGIQDNPANRAKALDNLADLDADLKDIDQMLKDMQALEDAIKQANGMKNELGEGKTMAGKRPGLAGKGDQAGQGKGLGGFARPYKGRGNKGSGQRPMGADQDGEFEDVKAKSRLDTNGKFLAGITVNGMPPEGAEARREYVNAVKAAVKEAEDALPKVEVPANRRKQVKRYFGTLHDGAYGEE